MLIKDSGILRDPRDFSITFFYHFLITPSPQNMRSIIKVSETFRWKTMQVSGIESYSNNGEFVF